MLAWSSHVLATRPEIQDRLREDIICLAGQNCNPPFSEIDALPYLDSFVNEMLRVYPPGKQPLSQINSSFKALMVPASDYLPSCLDPSTGLSGRTYHGH